MTDDLLDDWADLGHPHVEPEPEPIPEPVPTSEWEVGLYDEENESSILLPVNATLDGTKITLSAVVFEGLPLKKYVGYGVYHHGKLWRQEPFPITVLGPDDNLRLSVVINF